MKIEINSSSRGRVQGTGASRRLRRERQGARASSTAADKAAQRHRARPQRAAAFQLKIEAFHASILDMELDGEKSQVLLRDFQMHPFKPQILHVDFQRVDANKKIHMKVPLHFVNAEISPGVKVGGGVVQHVMNELEIACLPEGPAGVHRGRPEGRCRPATRSTVGDSSCPQGVEPIVLEGRRPAVATVVMPEGR